MIYKETCLCDLEIDNQGREARVWAHLNKPIGFDESVSPKQSEVLNFGCIHDGEAGLQEALLSTV